MPLLGRCREKPSRRYENKCTSSDKMKFTIMWENQSRGVAGVADERDLLENLLPFWIENYFRQPSYLKIDNKPLLLIYRPEVSIQYLLVSRLVRFRPLGPLQRIAG